MLVIVCFVVFIFAGTYFCVAVLPALWLSLLEVTPALPWAVVDMRQNCAWRVVCWRGFYRQRVEVRRLSSGQFVDAQTGFDRAICRIYGFRCLELGTAGLAWPSHPFPASPWP